MLLHTCVAFLVARDNEHTMKLLRRLHSGGKSQVVKTSQGTFGCVVISSAEEV